MNEPQSVIHVMSPELILIVAACALFLIGIVNRAAARRACPWVAVVALLGVFLMEVMRGDSAAWDWTGALRVFAFAHYIKLIAAGVGVLLVLLAWPTDSEATGNPALQFGTEAGEFYGLMLLSISGIFLVAGANDLILLFLGIELASIPTYIMVSVSRPLPAAQEAGVKYFFLGAMSAAVMLMGFTFLYGTTGTTNLLAIAQKLGETNASGAGMVHLSSWQMLAAVLLIGGFAFKMAAVPLHFYAGDVYQGAATPVTAFLSFVPKTSGFVALIKVLYALGSGSTWAIPTELGILLWFIAALTMTIGNVLGLIQLNVKRVLAYSSIAHSGYMLVGIATLVLAQPDTEYQQMALQGVLFYLAAYGITNAAAFGVLILLPARGPQANRPATSAETFEDLAGAGRRHPGLGLAMAIACFSLIGIPTTVGFFGKLYLIRPALLPPGAPHRMLLIWLVVLTMINAAISAAYYLKIVAAMFLRSEPRESGFGVAPSQRPAVPTSPTSPIATRSMPITLAIALSTAGVLLFGIVLPATEALNNRVADASNNIDQPQSLIPTNNVRTAHVP
jgi:NADH-quinone oxidoreductase subunit N